MDQTTLELAAYLVDKLRQTPRESRLIVGLAGSPAAGKSSFCHRLMKNINAALKTTNDASATETDTAILVGLDGWHLTRAQLSAFPDAKLAHERRGIHWTFDGKGYVEFVKALRLPLSSPATPSEITAITAPAFSHALKDPTPDAVSVYPHHRLVLIEGLYTFLSIKPWSEASALLDERWFLHVDETEACRRLVKRHVETGICSNEEEARLRAEGNDLPNGRFVVENMLRPTRFIESVEDDGLANELL
ncbi:p-loop containing nucleoside triphosphate hydrolase protein [Mycena sanguinolenta]|uniref:p-loop containing nucleoside triphosphate hydrolase protein n=1 Tax=Mycena sanguinolenta TaxID=230812 RepID=A0A8H7D2M8_9AGAR|nr:p-loop containing nucleoside triphosphate hydrolase protein [Mycena sanguinolenta]